MNIRVLIAEDEPLARRSVRALLASARDIEIVGEARDGIEAVRLAETLSPDVVLMDLSMPGQDGFRALEQIRALHRGTKTIILSMHVDEDLIAHAMRHGVHGYLVKDCTRLELLSALRAVYQSRPFFSSAALEHLPKSSGTS